MSLEQEDRQLILGLASSVTALTRMVGELVSLVGDLLAEREADDGSDASEPKHEGLDDD